jgi:CMP-N-acetylneuraminic acid synthetase
MKIIAIIPARGGSKSIPNKNIKKLNGAPLINYTIENCLKSSIFDYIIVSTDSKKIFQKVKKYKKILTFDRNKNISKDNSKTEEVVIDVLDKLRLLKNYRPDWIFITEPTSPLRSKATLINAKNILLKNKKINSLISLLKLNNIPGLLRNNKFNYIQNRKSRRQDRISFYMESSTLYCVNYKYFIKTKKIVEKKPFGFEIPKLECIDINDFDDFKIAEALKKININ